MRCPKCGGSKAKYEESRKECWGKKKKSGREIIAPKPRTNFKATCPECNWRGEIKDEEESLDV